MGTPFLAGTPTANCKVNKFVYMLLIKGRGADEVLKMLKYLAGLESCPTFASRRVT